MAKYMHFPPVPKSEGEVIGSFLTIEAGVLRQVRELLDSTLPEEKRARTKREAATLIYRMEFCGGNWTGDAAIPENLRNKDMTLEFWPDGVALRFNCEFDFGGTDKSEPLKNNPYGIISITPGRAKRDGEDNP